MKLKDLAELLGMELPEKLKLKDFINGSGTDSIDFPSNDSNIELGFRIKALNICKEKYDNLEISIEKLKPSLEQITETIEEFFDAYNIPLATKKYTITDLIQAIHNLKPGGK